MDANDLALFGAAFSLAVLTFAAYVSRRVYACSKARLAELSKTMSGLMAESLGIGQKRSYVTNALDSKITRNAMQSIIKQAKEITSALIAGE